MHGQKTPWRCWADAPARWSLLLLCEAGAPRWATVGSDHTDCDMERHSIARPADVPRNIRPTVWPLAEVLPHWDRSILRPSWVYIDGIRPHLPGRHVTSHARSADLLDLPWRRERNTAPRLLAAGGGVFWYVGDPKVPQCGERFEIHCWIRPGTSYSAQLRGTTACLTCAASCCPTSCIQGSRDMAMTQKDPTYMHAIVDTRHV